jgi:hypothetical protein
MNYKNVKFAVDHLVFRKIIGYINSIIGSIVNKIKPIIEKFTNVENQVLEITDDNWADYITPRPKAVGVDVENNPINCGKLIICTKINRSFGMMLVGGSSTKNFSFLKIDEILNRELSNYLDGNKTFTFLFNKPCVLLDSAVGISNSKTLTDLHGYTEDRVGEKEQTIIIFNGQIKLPSNIQKVVFNCNLVNFINLSILPGEFKLNNSENTNDSSNSNENLNGRTITLLQNSSDGVDISTFTRLIEVNRFSIQVKQRVVSFDRKGFLLQSSSNPATKVNVENWGGIDTDSINDKLAYNYKNSSSNRLSKFDFFRPILGYVNRVNSEKLNPVCPSPSGKYNQFDYPANNANGNSDNNEACLSDNLFGVDTLNDTTTTYRNNTSNMIPRLRPGRAVELVWYNGYWYAK